MIFRRTGLATTSSGAAAAGVSDIGLGHNGPDAISGYMWDYGSDNAQVPHRRWLLYPQTEVMGTGDVPAQGSYLAADATWVIDSNCERTSAFDGISPFVAWPPPGFVPYAGSLPAMVLWIVERFAWVLRLSPCRATEFRWMLSCSSSALAPARTHSCGIPEILILRVDGTVIPIQWRRYGLFRDGQYRRNEFVV